MKKGLILLFFFITNYAFTQIEIKGQITDEYDEPIAGTSILVTALDSTSILAYAISESDGKYKITLDTDVNELIIEAKLLGFSSQSQKIQNKSQIRNFQLSSEVIKLKEVVAKANPIQQKGDTINYSVSAFAKEQDRSIGDVISRMPGIEVQSDGKILFQGKAINKFYIENLDMLEGRYNLANKNLSHKDVASVQILENHQPIKALDSLVYSDRAALNIKLKNSFTFSGQAKVGLGVSPFLWEGNLTPMLFTRKKQMLTTYQTNNMGNDVGQQFITFNMSSFQNPLNNSFAENNWLNIQPISTPNFSDKRWLDNNIHVFSTNTLFKINKDYQFKLNVSYNNDYQQLKGYTNTRFNTVIDTIQIAENQYNQLFFNTLETNIILEKNVKKSYVKNTLSLKNSWNAKRGFVRKNSENLYQELEDKSLTLSNTFQGILPFGEQFLNVNSKTKFHQKPQNLSIRPGQLLSIFNNDESYNLTVQDLSHEQFSTTNSIGMDKEINNFTFSPSIGFEWLKQSLNSSIFIDDFERSEDEFINDMTWNQLSSYIQLLTYYKGDDWRISLTAPLIHASYDIRDKRNDLGQDIKRLSFRPRINLTYEPNAFWKLNLGSGYSEQFGNINQLHYAFLIKNYRSIQKISTPLPENKTFSIMSNFSYKNPINSFFWNLRYNHGNTRNNLMYSTQIHSNGATELTAITQPNTCINHQFSTGISKYFGRISTNTNLKLNYRLGKFQQLLNNELMEVNTQNASLSATIEKDLSELFNVEIKSDWTFNKNQFQGQSNDWINMQSHKFIFSAYPSKNQYLGLQAEWYCNEILQGHNNYLFSDLTYRYTWEKYNLDFELRWNNIFNTQDYRILNLDNYSYVETNFEMRPSHALIMVRFSF